jgi:hypothetical protein
LQCRENPELPTLLKLHQEKGELKMKITRWIALPILICLATLGLWTRGNAQQAVPGATPVQQAQPFTTCNNTASNTGTGAAGFTTTTVTPPAGQYVYICGINVIETATAAMTGAAGPETLTTTDLPINLIWWGNNSTQVIGWSQTVLDEQYPWFLKGSAPGTAFTIVAAAAGVAGSNYRVNVTYFTAP